MVVSALDQKLLRDLWKLRGQVIAIALVIASGVATLVMALSTIEALKTTSDAYYQQTRFADVFATMKRAPRQALKRIETIDGVQNVEARISQFAQLQIAGFDEPILGNFLSLPAGEQSILNQLVLRSGDWLSPIRHNEVIITEAFAEAQQLKTGDRIHAILNGKKRNLRIVGIALSPEFIYTIGPGALVPDDARYGVMWMSEEALEAAFDLKDAFNSLSLSVRADVNSDEVIQQLDAILAPYGGVPAFSRKDQVSNWFVNNEIEQQKTIGAILPLIFIGVSVFLSNIVLSRLIATQRTEIGLLKAYGYNNVEVASHYIKLILVVSLCGVVLGLLMGTALGRLNTQMYADFFRFPILIYQPGFNYLLLATAISISATALGSWRAVSAAIQLSPAEAMLPPSPPVFKQHGIHQSALTRALDQPSRIIIRNISRWPIRAALTACGIAMATALIIMALQWSDSLNHLSRNWFFEAQRQHVTLSFAENTPISVLNNVARLPGVLQTEPMRTVAVEFKANGVLHRGAIQGIQPGSELSPIYDDAQRRAVALPAGGIAMASRLAEKLNISPGDKVTIQVLEGRRPQFAVQVSRLFETYIGLPVFMELSTLNRHLLEMKHINQVHLLLDKDQQNVFFSALTNTPKVSGVLLKTAAFESFDNTVTHNVKVFNRIFTILAMLLAIGITYNATRIALSERSRELATLRVLGFSQAETAYVLMGEVLLLGLVSLPLGCLAGYGLVWSMAASFDTELFRIPLTIQPDTYGYAMLFILISVLLSALFVRYRVNNLDLIRVLKTRE